MEVINFFDGVRELSHSAFWCWVLRNHTSPDFTGEAGGPRQVAFHLLDRLGLDPRTPGVNTVREYPLPEGAGRIDIWMELTDGVELYIECKCESLLNEGQIERYQRVLPPQAVLAVIDLGFDFGAIPKVAERLGNPDRVIGVEESIDLLEPFSKDHWLLGEYLRWLIHRRAEWKRTERAVFGSSRQDRQEALRSHEGQFLFSSPLFERSLGWTKRGSSFGKPWTQLWFCEPADDSARRSHDALFWRFDEWADGHTLSLRQYNWSVDEGERSQRFRWLQTTFESIRQDYPELRFADPRAGAGNEREIARLLIEYSDPATLLRGFPSLHARLEEILRECGWPVF